MIKAFYKITGVIYGSYTIKRIKQEFDNLQEAKRAMAFLRADGWENVKMEVFLEWQK